MSAQQHDDPTSDTDLLDRLHRAAAHAPSATMDLAASFRRTRRRTVQHRTGALGVAAACVAGAAFAVPALVGGPAQPTTVAAGSGDLTGASDPASFTTPFGFVPQPGLIRSSRAMAETLDDGSLLVATGLPADDDGTQFVLVASRESLEAAGHVEHAVVIPRIAVLRADDDRLAEIRAAGSITPWAADVEDWSEPILAANGDHLIATFGSDVRRRPAFGWVSDDGAVHVVEPEIGCFAPLPGIAPEDGVCLSAALVRTDELVPRPLDDIDVDVDPVP